MVLALHAPINFAIRYYTAYTSPLIDPATPPSEALENILQKMLHEIRAYPAQSHGLDSIYDCRHVPLLVSRSRLPAIGSRRVDHSAKVSDSNSPVFQSWGESISALTITMTMHFTSSLVPCYFLIATKIEINKTENDSLKIKVFF